MYRLLAPCLTPLRAMVLHSSCLTSGSTAWPQQLCTCSRLAAPASFAAPRLVPAPSFTTTTLKSCLTPASSTAWRHCCATAQGCKLPAQVLSSGGAALRRAAAVKATQHSRLLSVEIGKTPAQHGMTTHAADMHGGSELSLLAAAPVVFSCREYAGQAASGDPAALCLLLLQASLQPLTCSAHGADASVETGSCCLLEVAITWGGGEGVCVYAGPPEI